MSASTAAEIVKVIPRNRIHRQEIERDTREKEVRQTNSVDSERQDRHHRLRSRKLSMGAAEIDY